MSQSGLNHSLLQRWRICKSLVSPYIDVSGCDNESSKKALYNSLVTHSLALVSLQREHKKHLEREKVLGDILDALRSGYNPNYQDMAVLEAVRGWEIHAGLPHIGEKEEGSDGDAADAAKTEEEELEEGMWSAEKLDKDLDGLLRSDHVSLLLEHEEHIRSPSPDSLRK
jgi:protein kinase C substrate 80K-H